MIQYLLFGTSKSLNISDITKRIGNFFKLPIQLFFRASLIPNSRYYFDFDPVLPGLGLFHTGPDYDPVEKAFARRARKKKKKKGRGL